MLLAGLGTAASGIFLLHPGAAAQIGSVPAPPIAVAATLTPGSPGLSEPSSGSRARARPVQLRLTSLGVNAPVVPVQVSPTGALAVPDDPAVLGWWDHGAAAGLGRGTVVLDGHVDSARLGVGVFAGLRDLRLGDLLEVTTAGGQSISYAVTARRSYPKADLPASVFDQELGERLVLITCGGRFDQADHHYSDNVVLFALPVKGTS